MTQPDLLQTLCPADRAASTVMGHVEPVRGELVIGIFNRFLQGDGMPFPSNMFFSGPSFSASISWIPVVYTEPFL